jgi:hypothetical protein
MSDFTQSLSSLAKRGACFLLLSFQTLGDEMFDAEYEENEQDTRYALEFMTNDFTIQQKRTTVIAILFVSSCGVAYPFMAGHSLHRYWFSFGKFLPLLSIVLFVVLTIQLLRFHFVWQERRKAQRDLKDLLIRRKA